MMIGVAPLVFLGARLRALAPIAALASCGAPGRPPLPAPSPPAAAVAPRGPEAGTIAYDVAYDPASMRLAVEARFPPGTPALLAVERGAERWLEGVSAPAGSPGRLADGRVAVECSRGCVVRYAYALGGAGRALRDLDLALTAGATVVAPASTWLLAPVDAPGEVPVVYTVQPTAPAAFVSGLAPEPGTTRRRTTLAGLRRAPYSAFGDLEVIPIHDGDADFTLAVPRGAPAPPNADLVAWVERSARAVRSTLGTFPARHAALVVLPVPGDDVEVGFSMAGSSIVLRVGRDTPRAALARDWVLTHEMLHFACPTQPAARDWAEEGLATYVEPFARARAGLVTWEEAWSGLVRGFGFGQPEPGDEGLDRTRTWGRVYWGGALFYFVADYAIRVRTEGKKTLFDALAAVVRDGGTNAAAWPLERVFAVGDAATGVPVLTELLLAHGPRTARFDYEAALADLGVQRRGEVVVLDPTAPRAALARAW